MSRLLEGGVALAFGAADAAVTAKVSGTGPGKVPWPVYLEGAGIAAGFFGGSIGIPAEARDSLLLSALALAGARVTRLAMAGKLAQGPAAWGGDGDTYPALVASGGDGMGGGFSGASRARLLGRGGGFSLYPVTQEAPGVAG